MVLVKITLMLTHIQVLLIMKICHYTSDTTGTKFELRDVLDFRPRVDDGGTINSGQDDRSFDGTGSSLVDVPEFGSDITSDLEFYLNRIDKIFLTREGNLRVVEGVHQT